MQVEIRRARADDMGAIIGLMLLGVDEADWLCPDPDPYVAAHQIIDLTLGPAPFSWVATVDGAVVGFLALEVACWAWQPRAQFLRNYHYYVHKDYRASSAASDLLTAAKTFAAESGAELQITITFGGERAALKDEFVKRHGGVYKGATYSFAPPAAQAAAAE